jgi:hypothetical protein
MLNILSGPPAATSKQANKQKKSSTLTFMPLIGTVPC